MGEQDVQAENDSEDESVLPGSDDYRTESGLQDMPFDDPDEGPVDAEASDANGNDDAVVGKEDATEGGDSGALQVQGSAALQKIMPKDRYRAYIEAKEEEDCWYSDTNLKEISNGETLDGTG